MSPKEQKMVQRLGDGSHICDECWKKEYPDKPEPENNWVLAVCDYCDYCED